MYSLLEKYGFPLREGENEGGSGAAAGDTPAGEGGAAPASDGGVNVFDDDNGGETPKGDPAPGDQKPGEAGEAEAKVDPKPGEGEYVDDPKLSDEENAAKRKEHDDAKKAKDDKNKSEPIDPASYKIDIPEGYSLDAGVEQSFREFAASHNLDQSAVDALKDMQIQLYSKAANDHARQVSKWAEELESDKEIGGRDFDANMGAARMASREFLSKETRELLANSGFRSHPALVRDMVRLGKLMGENPTLRADPTSREGNALQTLYPNAG